MTLKSALASGALLSFMTINAAADTLTLTPGQQGSISRRANGILPTNISYDPSSTSVSVSFQFISCTGCPVNETRGFALFDIPTKLGDVVSAVLNLDTGPLFLGNGSLSLFDITSAPSAFAVAYSGDSGPGNDLFNDLGNGALYASSSVPSAGGSLSLALSPTALSNLIADSGGVFGIGFMGQAPLGIPISLSSIRLNIETVPEPATTLLVLMGGAGLMLLGMTERRNKARKANQLPRRMRDCRFFWTSLFFVGGFHSWHRLPQLNPGGWTGSNSRARTNS